MSESPLILSKQISVWWDFRFSQGCCTMQSGRNLLTFQRCLFHPSSRPPLIALMMEAVSTPEMSVNFNQTTQRNIPEDSHLQISTEQNESTERPSHWTHTISYMKRKWLIIDETTYIMNHTIILKYSCIQLTINISAAIIILNGTHYCSFKIWIYSKTDLMHYIWNTYYILENTPLEPSKPRQHCGSVSTEAQLCKQILLSSSHKKGRGSGSFQTLQL
jgi:hypothetical protein